VTSLLSLLFYYRGLNGVRASHATIAELAFPATGLLVNWLILHQTIDLGQWLGFALVRRVYYSCRGCLLTLSLPWKLPTKQTSLKI